MKPDKLDYMCKIKDQKDHRKTEVENNDLSLLSQTYKLS